MKKLARNKLATRRRQLLPILPTFTRLALQLAMKMAPLKPCNFTGMRQKRLPVGKVGKVIGVRELPTYACSNAKFCQLGDCSPVHRPEGTNLTPHPYNVLGKAIILHRYLAAQRTRRGIVELSDPARVTPDSTIGALFDHSASAQILLSQRLLPCQE